jgi:hypothetical protein
MIIRMSYISLVSFWLGLQGCGCTVILLVAILQGSSETAIEPFAINLLRIGQRQIRTRLIAKGYQED